MKNKYIAGEDLQVGQLVYFSGGVAYKSKVSDLLSREDADLLFPQDPFLLHPVKMQIEIQKAQNKNSNACPYCGCTSTRVNLRNQTECSGCAAPL